MPLALTHTHNNTMEGGDTEATSFGRAIQCMQTAACSDRASALPPPPQMNGRIGDGLKHRRVAAGSAPLWAGDSMLTAVSVCLHPPSSASAPGPKHTVAKHRGAIPGRVFLCACDSPGALMAVARPLLGFSESCASENSEKLRLSEKVCPRVQQRC